MAYLYLLKDLAADSFKIGVSVNPYQRSTSLSQAIDLSASRQVPVQSGDAYKVEKVLHYLYRDYALIQAPSDGFTEWFDIAAWDPVIQFLADNQANLGVDVPEAIETPEMTGARQSLRGIERHQRIQQNAEARQARYDDNSVAAAEIFRELLLDLATLGLSVGVLPKARAIDDRDYFYISGSKRVMDAAFLEDTLGRLAKIRLATVDGGGRVFESGYFTTTGHRRALIEIRLALDSDLTASSRAVDSFESPLVEIMKRWVPGRHSELARLLRWQRIAQAHRAEFFNEIASHNCQTALADDGS